MAETFENVEKYLKFWTENNDLCRQVNEDIIAFIGPTKAGKSTLINSLMKKKLICQIATETDEFYITKRDEDDGGPKIGSTAESESLKPQCYGKFLDTDLLMWDFPGFGDNKGIKQEVANAIAIKTVLCQQKSVRFILVVPFDVIKNADPFEFFRLLNNLLNISPDIANHLILAASKMGKGSLKASLKKLLNLSFDNSLDAKRLEVVKNAYTTIEYLLLNNALLEFKAPTEVNDKDPYTLPNEDAFKECLDLSVGKNISNSYLVISDKATADLIKLYNIVYTAIRLEIDEIISHVRRDTQDHLNYISNPKLSSSEIEGYCKRKIEDYRYFISDLSNLHEFVQYVGSATRRKKALNICINFKNLEELRNNCGPNEVAGEGEFFSILNNEVNEAILQLERAT